MKKYYIIVKGRDMEELEKKVNEYIDKGYTPKGDIQTGAYYRVYQPMVLDRTAIDALSYASKRRGSTEIKD